MATKATPEVQGLARAQSAYNAMSANVKALIPEPTADNAAEFFGAIRKYDPKFNEFGPALINAVIIGTVKASEAKNPLSNVYKEMREYGYTVEEIFADKLRVVDWAACDASTYDDVFGVEPPRIYTNFHSINFQKRAKASISNVLLKRASNSYAGFNDIVDTVKRALVTSMTDEESKAGTKLFALTHAGGFAYPVKINSNITLPQDSGKVYLDEAALKYNVAKEKEIVHKFAVGASRDYNWMGVSQLTDISRVLFITTPEYLSSQDVGVLAAAFNMDKTEFLGRTIEVKDLGGAEKDGAIGFIVSEDWFQIWLQSREMTQIYDPAHRIWNFWYFTDGTFSTSLMENCVELVDSMKSITSVTITAGQKAAKCASTEIVAKVVNGGETGGWSSKLNWSITGNNSKKTFISPSGILYVANDETASTISVTATSAQDPSQTDTKDVTVTAS